MEDKTIEITELAQMVDGEVIGDGSLTIHGFAPLDTAGPGEISFLVKAKSAGLLEASAASAFLVGREFEASGWTVIRVDNPYLAAAIIQNYFLAEPFVAEGIHKTAVVGPDCTIDEQISIAPLVVIGARARIGARVRIDGGAVIGDDVSIGEDCWIKANVSIEHGCELGSRVTIHPGTVIGSDGYGYATDKLGCHVKRPQLGIVRIGDDVEIGANSTVDRATFGVTWIKAGTKIDNLVQVAHNVVVGENSLLVAQVGISGSTILGRNVVFGGQAGAAGHQTIGDRTMVAGKSAVHGDVGPDSRLSGVPAIDGQRWFKAVTLFGKLPELARDLRRMKKELARLTASDQAGSDKV